jgi:hypothetical protein
MTSFTSRQQHFLCFSISSNVLVQMHVHQMDQRPLKNVQRPAKSNMVMLESHSRQLLYLGRGKQFINSVYFFQSGDLHDQLDDSAAKNQKSCRRIQRCADNHRRREGAVKGSVCSPCRCRCAVTRSPRYNRSSACACVISSDQRESSPEDLQEEAFSTILNALIFSKCNFQQCMSNSDQDPCWPIHAKPITGKWC